MAYKGLLSSYRSFSDHRPPHGPETSQGRLLPIVNITMVVCGDSSYPWLMHTDRYLLARDCDIMGNTAKCYRKVRVDMAFVATPNAAKVVVSFTTDTKPWSNTFWFTKSLFTDEDLTLLAALVGGTYGSELKGLLSVESAFVSAKAYDMRSSSGGTALNVDDAGAGTQSGDALPIQAALVLTLYTGGRGRSSRGRVFVSGFGEDKFDSGSFDPTTMAAVVAVASGMKAACAGEGWNLVVNSYQHDGVVLSQGATRQVTDIVSRSFLLGTQRRRTQRP